ncbi:protein lifeguard 3 [Halyomorpha halys]|uniref:protein lifeguard 3 n=1 Tax=Halyomorpha halys TaxID=286706 RepID=UPI0006D4E82E|nr:protein lifeguard 3 [Halyomorpha halys]
MRAWEEPDEPSNWDKVRRKDFAGKVFMLTGAMLMVSAVVVVLPQVSDEIEEAFVYNAVLIGIIAGVFSTMSLLVLVCCYRARHIFPLNLILLIILTISYGLIAALVSSRYKTSVVLISFVTTVAIVILIGIIAKWGPVDITGCGWFMCGLSVGLTIVLTVAMIVGIFYYIPLVQLIIACVVVLVYIIFLMFDMQMIIGGRREELDADEYILGAVILFKDIIIIFLYMMEIIAAITNRN